MPNNAGEPAIQRALRAEEFSPQRKLGETGDLDRPAPFSGRKNLRSVGAGGPQACLD